MQTIKIRNWTIKSFNYQNWSRQQCAAHFGDQLEKLKQFIWIFTMVGKKRKPAINIESDASTSSAYEREREL